MNCRSCFDWGFALMIFGTLAMFAMLGYAVYEVVVEGYRLRG